MARVNDRLFVNCIVSEIVSSAVLLCMVFNAFSCTSVKNCFSLYNSVLNSANKQTETQLLNDFNWTDTIKSVSVTSTGQNTSRGLKLIDRVEIRDLPRDWVFSGRSVGKVFGDLSWLFVCNWVTRLKFWLYIFLGIALRFPTEHDFGIISARAHKRVRVHNINSRISLKLSLRANKC